MFHNPGWDPRWDPAFFRRDPTWDRPGIPGGIGGIPPHNFTWDKEAIPLFKQIVVIINVLGTFFPVSLLFLKKRLKILNRNKIQVYKSSICNH